ncbi:MAG: hypothetical protein ABIH46_12570 [Chloroflexota bacterium]
MTIYRTGRQSIPAERRVKPRWWLKSCPRCHGDLYEEEDWGETSIQCLLCGRALIQDEEDRLLGLAVKNDWELNAEPIGARLERAA